MITTTVADLRKIAPRAKASIIAPIAAEADEILRQFGINANARRLAHFWAQASYETDGLVTLEEYASGRAYEGRKDLGNVRKGDGVRYKGRGIFMLTGRYNYRTIGKKLGVDLEGNPEKASDPLTSLRIACLYWRSREMNLLADISDWDTAIVRVTRAINGGRNGLADRRIYTRRARPIFEDRKPISIPDSLIVVEPEPVPEVETQPETDLIGIPPDVGPAVPIAPTAPLVDAVKTGDFQAHPGFEWKIGLMGFGIVAAFGLLIVF